MGGRTRPGKDIGHIGEEGCRQEEEQVHRLQAGNELAGLNNLKKVSVDRASDGVGGGVSI